MRRHSGSTGIGSTRIAIMQRILAALAPVGMSLVVGGTAWGCRQTSETPSSRSQALHLLESNPDTGVELRAMLPRDTILAGDGRPVHVVFAIVNGTHPTLFNNHPDRFAVQVFGPDAKAAASLEGSGPLLKRDVRREILLPANGALVQRQDLRCVNDYFNGSAVKYPTTSNMCMARYTLAVPGRYTVIVEYLGLGVYRDADSVQAEMRRREYRPGNDRPLVPPLQLADTVTLVVIGT